MKHLPLKPPRYLRHKPKNQAFVYVRGADGKRKQVYLGIYGSPESHRRYRELVAQYFQTDGPRDTTPEGGPGSISIAELSARYLQHAEVYYRRPDGTQTKEVENAIYALRPLLKLYRDQVVDDFGPLKLKRVREQMIEDGLARTSINYRINKIRRMFKWGTENELVPIMVFQGLQAVAGLKRGRSPARETEKVLPVPEDDFRAVLPFLNRHVRAIAELQWLTGARSSELLCMRTDDIDRSGKVWIYRPAQHKTQHHGKKRMIALGPRCRKILRAFLRFDGQPLFQPAEAEAERLGDLHKKRKTRVQPSQIERARRRQENPKRTYNETFTVGNYAQHIRRACEKAGVPHWCPHRLRHSAATRVRSTFGLDVSRAILGHSSTPVTELYAERDQALICDVIEKIG